MRRFLLILFILATLFLATAAPRGGGFGGGRGGGFSSSRSGGGFGRSSGGFGGYRGPVFFRGPRFFYFGRGPGLAFFLVLIGGIAVVATALAAVNWLNSRFTTVGVALNLRNGARYAKRLDAILAESDFTTPSERAKALHRIAKLIEVEDVADGFATVRDPFGNKLSAGERAESLAREQMKHLGITAETVNVAAPESGAVRLDLPASAPSVTQVVRIDACVLALVGTVRRRAAAGMAAGSAGEALTLLHLLYEVPGKDLDALYFFYVPHAPEPLDSASANRIFLDLRATAHA